MRERDRAAGVGFPFVWAGGGGSAGWAGGTDGAGRSHSHTRRVNSLVPVSADSVDSAVFLCRVCVAHQKTSSRKALLSKSRYFVVVQL